MRSLRHKVLVALVAVAAWACGDSRPATVSVDAGPVSPYAFQCERWSSDLMGLGCGFSVPERTQRLREICLFREVVAPGGRTESNVTQVEFDGWLEPAPELPGARLTVTATVWHDVTETWEGLGIGPVDCFDTLAGAYLHGLEHAGPDSCEQEVATVCRCSGRVITRIEAAPLVLDEQGDLDSEDPAVQAVLEDNHCLWGDEAYLRVGLGQAPWVDNLIQSTHLLFATESK